MVNGVDMAEDITVIDGGTAPFAIDSDCMLFFWLVSRLSSACDSGSIGGDAQRLEAVLTGALENIKHTTAAWTRKRFELMTGLLVAIVTGPNHALDGFIDRGFEAPKFFRDLATAWRQLLNPNGRAGTDGPKRLKEDGVTPAMIRYAKEDLKNLKEYLESGNAGGVSIFGGGPQKIKFACDPAAR